MSERHILRCTCGAWRHAKLTCSTCQNLTTRYANAPTQRGSAEAQAGAGRPTPTRRKLT
jgi:hypothetical protein